MNTWFTAAVPGSTPHALVLRKVPTKKEALENNVRPRGLRMGCDLLP